jgi:hypothetical protein
MTDEELDRVLATLSVAAASLATGRRWGMELIMTSKPAGAALATLAGVAAAYFGFLRRWHMTRGATAQEAGGQVAGDELMPNADIVATRVVEINAPPAAIWPWLVQMGPGRGGAYTYAWIERRLGIDIRNTDRIIPELQDLKVGDEIRCPATRCAWNASIPARCWSSGPAITPGYDRSSSGR